MSEITRATPLAAASLVLLALGCSAAQPASAGGTVHAVAWPIDNTQTIGGYTVTAVGAPKPSSAAPTPSVCFDGGANGLVFPVNPLDAQPEFTIQALFKPDAGGPAKQQFLHLQDGTGNRVLMEIRLAPNGSWYLHSFVRFGDQEAELASSDRLHDAGEWHWVALTYKDGELSQFVDAQRQELQLITLPPMAAGEMSVGMRLSNENGFKGCIRELRFATAALPAPELARDTAAPSVLARSP